LLLENAHDDILVPGCLGLSEVLFLLYDELREPAGATLAARARWNSVIASLTR
jgi:hypothetical protein